MTARSEAATRVVAPAIALEGVGKRYGGVSVLRDVSLTIAPGEIHGLMGENGAGKSTLLKILGGAIAADEGRIEFDGAAVRIGRPRDAIALGVSLISQELSLVRARSVLENVFLGRWAHRAGFARRADDLRVFRELTSQTGFDLDPSVPVSSLSVGQAQQVEILKALARGSRVLCLDEPTAALGEADTENLLRVLRALAADGTTVVIVSHFLEEVLDIADRVTILRDGGLVATDPAAAHTPASLVRLMVGREVQALAKSPAPVPADAPIALRAEGLSTSRIADVSLHVRRGEVLGLVGLVGSGRTETLRALFGADRLTRGTITVAAGDGTAHGTTVARQSVRDAIRRGLALVPESRKDEGLVLGRTASENIALASLGRRELGGFIRRAAEKRDVDRVAALLDVRGAMREIPVGLLSGGNQQKALFAKWLIDPPRVFLVDEPTRGVDIAAKVKIHDLILDLAAAGTAVIVASSELEEVVALSHRLNVMRGGRVVAEFDASADRHDIMAAAFH
jgi:ribose transport system ATP-binding protein